MRFLAKQFLRGCASVAAPLLWKNYLRKNKREWPEGGGYALTISFDYDHVEDVSLIPELCELLDDYSIPASHACVGKFVEHFKREHAFIRKRGDEAINHSYSHPDGPLNPFERFNELGAQRMEEEVIDAEKAFKKVFGKKPAGFRTPHFGNLNSQRIYNILEKRKYLYSSSTNLTTTQSRGVPYHPGKRNFHERGEPAYKLLELPVFSCPVHYYPVFDSWHCFETRAHHYRSEFFNAFRKAVGIAEEYGSYLNLYFDPRHVVGDADFEMILDFASRARAWVATSQEVAEWWLK